VSGTEDELKGLVEEAMHLCVNGERAPGGNETWAAWHLKAERLLRSLQPLAREEQRLLTVDERLMARHYLQELKEGVPGVRDAMEPYTGVVRITDEAWYGQWAALTRNLDYFTEEVVRKRRPATPYGRI